MKKAGLLFSIALASVFGANAQSVKINDVTLKPGESGYVTLTFDEEVTWEEGVMLAARVSLPDGVTVGKVKDVDFGGIMEDPDDFTLDLRLLTKSYGNMFALLATNGSDIMMKQMNAEVTIKVPVTVAEDAEEGAFPLTAIFDEELDQQFEAGAYDFIFNEAITEGTFTISSSSTPVLYDATVYTATGASPMQFSNAAQVETYVAAHPNEIVEFASAPAEFAEVYNVVVAGAAKSIILDSRYAYAYAGEEAFDAESVSFDYWIGVYASKTGGWNSLAIPFTGKPDAEPFTTADMTSGEYWAKVFAGSTAEGLTFENLDAAQFEANKSYLVAFPGSDYGVNEFASSSITISAANTKVYPATSKKTPGSPYSMTTVYAGSTPANAYVLNPAGTMFELKENAEPAAPFTAFASAESGAPVLRSLAILDANQGITSAADAAVASTTVYGEDGEIVIIASEAGVASIVNMNGQVVKANVAYNEGETRVAIAAGAYVVAGQVVIVK